ncbi:hypothetical protein TrRE_jg1421 [Triparma retinervis]|uniref:Uncharacterized protein n=1 Tax=Triparma retinervis TaxID=2557542 RepID=A0A9W6ZPG1_9STRA|nr:hypothetical protein TrRE_jg1421 [Triparma retinervis]
MKFSLCFSSFALASGLASASPNIIYFTEMPAVSSYTAYDFVAGSASCGSRYYAAAVQAFISWGLMITEDGETNVVTHEDFPDDTNDKLVQNLWCDSTDPSGQTLTAVMSDTENPTYSVFKIHINDDLTVTTDLIADIPKSSSELSSGFSTEFQATPSGQEVYASWVVNDRSGKTIDGSLKRVDVKTGEVTEWELKGDNGYIYSLFAKTDSATSVSAVLGKNGLYQSTTLTLNDDGTIAVGDLIEDRTLFKGGMPWQIDEEGGVGVAIGNKQPQVVEFMDVDSFEVLKSLGEEDIFGDVKNRKLGTVAMGR